MLAKAKHKTVVRTAKEGDEFTSIKHIFFKIFTYTKHNLKNFQNNLYHGYKI